MANISVRGPGVSVRRFLQAPGRTVRRGIRDWLSDGNAPEAEHRSKASAISAGLMD